MKGIERQYLRECINALCKARLALLALECGEAVTKTKLFGKKDTYRLDAETEHVITVLLCDRFHPHLPLVTEEIGSSRRLRGTEDQVICFADPMDRSKILVNFLNEYIGEKIGTVFSDRSAINRWESVYGGDIEVSGPFGSITAVRHDEVLFNVMINYATGTVYVASDEVVGSMPADQVYENQQQGLLRRSVELLDSFTPIIFGQEDKELGDNGYCGITYCNGSRYEDNLVASDVFAGRSIERIRDNNHLLYDRPGGPARILYLRNPLEVGFILSNGEKIGEWLGWLAYVKHYWPQLRAYEISFDTAWTRDQILMAPGPTYSILGDYIEDSGLSYFKDVKLNIEKLKHLNNPSRYRSTILVCSDINEAIKRHLSIQRQVELRFAL